MTKNTFQNKLLIVITFMSFVVAILNFIKTGTIENIFAAVISFFVFIINIYFLQKKLKKFSQSKGKK